MSDIVERLKKFEVKHALSADKHVSNLMLEAIAEIERLRALTEWRPIETAEKPETPWVKGHARYYLGFVPDDEMVFDQTLCMSVIWWEPKRGWVSDADVQVVPSHWLPLPPPPETP